MGNSDTKTSSGYKLTGWTNNLRHSRGARVTIRASLCLSCIVGTTATAFMRDQMKPNVRVWAAVIAENPYLTQHITFKSKSESVHNTNTHTHTRESNIEFNFGLPSCFHTTLALGMQQPAKFW